MFGRNLNQNITTASDANNMYSTGEVCIVPPAPVNDPDAALMAEIETGSILLDLDMQMQQQHQQRQPHMQSPSPSLSGFGYPPSPDTGLSFYPEQYPYHPAQTPGSSIHQQGGISEIDENDMVRLLMREMIPEILADCQKLNLHPNLYMWTPEQVRHWIACIVARFELGDIDFGNFDFNGLVLANLTDLQFRSLAPKCGDILFSIVYILKSSIPVEQLQAPQVVPQVQMGMHTIIPQMPAELHTAVPTTFTAQPRYKAAPMVSGQRAPEEHMYDSGSTGSPSDDEGSVQSPAPTGPNTSMTPNHTGGIQLWQFLKELLLQPNSYSYCIRWLNRDEGIFKIEDSVEVARLWGLRKNRPAMNYDKLSRSIRQYYRKGIMKKTEVSQRLVYQFVRPC